MINKIQIGDSLKVFGIPVVVNEIRRLGKNLVETEVRDDCVRVVTSSGDGMILLAGAIDYWKQ